MVSEKKSPNGDKNPLEGIKKPLESCRVYVTMAKAWYCGHRLYLNGALSMSCTSQLATTWRCSLDNWPGVVWCSLGSPKKSGLSLPGPTVNWSLAVDCLFGAYSDLQGSNPIRVNQHGLSLDVAVGLHGLSNVCTMILAICKKAHQWFRDPNKRKLQWL